jgi:hypothetical protein
VKTASGVFMTIIAAILLLMIAPFVVAATSLVYVTIRKPLYGYYRTIAVTLDQVGAAVIYGVEDWTISSYTHLLSKHHGCFTCKYFEMLIDAIARPFEKDHCRMAYENERLELKKERGEK